MTKVEFLKKLGHKIRILRDEKNLSQEKLVKKISIDRGQIGTKENGKPDTRIYTVKQIADALEVNIPELFNFAI